jgi:hypothetical protein
MNWAEVNCKKLEELFYDKNMTDRMIAEQYGVSLGKVRYRRKINDINIRNLAIRDVSKAYEKAINIYKKLK